VIELRVTRRRLELALAGLAGHDRATLDMGRASFWWLAARAAACARWQGSVELAACGHAELGAVRAAGEDVVQGRALTRLWLAGGAHGELRWPIGAVWGQIEAGASVPFLRDRYLFVPAVTIHETAPITGWICVGVGVRFP